MAQYTSTQTTNKGLTINAVLDTDLYAAVDMTAQQNPNSAFGVTKKYTLAQLKNYLQTRRVVGYI